MSIAVRGLSRWFAVAVVAAVAGAMLFSAFLLFVGGWQPRGFGGLTLPWRQQMSPKYDVDLRGKVTAPSLDGAVGWLNVDKPLTIGQLRGKIVLLDFWTYCCINCMHIIPDLKRLEQKYPDELVVIGVHSAKFANEKESGNIREAILRYEIEHPVANDADFAIWRKYGATGWPYLVIIDPEGKIVGTTSGEGNYELLDAIIGGLAGKYKGRLNAERLPLALEKDRAAPTVLLFPGKVLADGAGQRLFISDSNHNRILVGDLEGRVKEVVGQGTVGASDGSFSAAQFNHPQGLALDGDDLFVADTENHLLRRIDLKGRKVETIAGTGVQSRNWRGGPARSTALNSPWDVVVAGPGRDVFIAMAGSHQIWVYRRSGAAVQPFAGSGREGISDGLASEAALAQPSGITTDGADLYFADSEVSGIRKLALSSGRPRVETLIGTGLFDFGDRDGPFGAALLQHPLGVAYYEGLIYVADTYNHKVKAADPKSGTIATISGTGKPGPAAGGTPQFREPGGLSAADGKLYVADTNNHAIRVIDLKTRAVSTLDVTLPESAEAPEFDVFGTPDRIDATGKSVPAEGTVEIAFAFPQGYHFNDRAKPQVQLRVTGGDGRLRVGRKFNPEIAANVLRFPVDTLSVERAVKVEAALLYYYCTDNYGICLIGSALLEAPLAEGDGAARFGYTVTPP